MPNQLDPGFIKVGSTNLSQITVFMIWEYIISDEWYNAPDVRAIKATL